MWFWKKTLVNLQYETFVGLCAIFSKNLVNQSRNGSTLISLWIVSEKTATCSQTFDLFCLQSVSGLWWLVTTKMPKVLAYHGQL